MTGIYKDNLRCFDDPKCSDIVLVVQDKKFHVLKFYLATHSSYFKAMFLGMFSDSKKSEIKLEGIDADDFQNYLEVFYGDYASDDYTVEGILLVADMFDTQIVIKKCQEFLMKKSKKTLKKKLKMSIRYNLDNLKKSSSDTMNVTEKKMLKQIIEKQNEQDKINQEVIGNQQKLMEKLQSIGDKQDGRKRKREETSSDNPEEVSSSLTEIKSPIPTPKVTGKCFVLKHTFKNVSKLENSVYVYSETYEHFGVLWRMYIYRNNEHLALFTTCINDNAKGIWSIETGCEVKMMSKNGNLDIHKSFIVYKPNEVNMNQNPPSLGWYKFLKWDEVGKTFLIDDNLTFEISYKIKNMTGIYKDDLRCFDDSECSDIVLIVQNKKFHVLKLYLAAHSSYFNAMFLEMFSESEKSEIPLTGIDADDFQKYLEVLYGDDAIDEYTVEGILIIADVYGTPVVVKKCQEFLMEESKKTMKKKLELSVRFNLEELKKKCLSEIKTSRDIRRVLPDDICELDHTVMAELLKKSLATIVIASKR